MSYHNAVSHSPAQNATARQFLPAALEILETPASPVGRAIGATIIAFFAATIVWASFSRVEIIAVAPGKIVPSARTKTIQPLEPGIVREIHVRDGDRVTAGQVLVELDRTVTLADQRRTAHDLLSAQLDVARLTGLRNAFTSESAAPVLIPPDGAPATDVEKARAAMLTQASEQAAKLASLRQQSNQKAAEVDEVTATIAKIDASMPFLEEEESIREKAMNIQYGNRLAYLDARARLVDQQNERIVQKQKLAEAYAARQGLEQQLDQTRSGYEHQVFSDLADADRKAGEFAQDFIKAEQKSNEQVLRSPINGTVQQLSIFTVGGVVTPAEQLMLVVPVDSKIEAEAMISNRDIGFVTDGQSAEVKIDTFNFTRYGLIEGKIINVSRDALIKDKPPDPKAQNNNSGALSDSSEPAGQELLYSARVSLNQAEMQIDNRTVPLSPGMAVTVEIKTGSRRIIDYVMSPLLRYQHESLRER